jgi:hypothetical protein
MSGQCVSAKDVAATTNPAEELLQLGALRSTHAVKDHLGQLARLLGHTNRARGEQRAAIADTAIRRGLVSIRELS